MCRVLVIDDRQSELDLMKFIVERAGCTFYGEAQPERVFKRIREIAPDLIVLDLRLPGDLSGLDIVSRLRQDADLAHIPVLAVTAVPELYPEVDALAAGCDAYLKKPFLAQAFIVNVRRLLGGGGNTA